ncbi:MAG: orotidine-5'-phosphate decarboxylase [Gemmatimonadales bacterium]|nr:MAG: orotidine-5'-phosphate decarboxylase [Gemmatimonadales bacterium]
MADIIVALDVPDAPEALRLVDRLGPELDFVKVGLELFTREGPDVVRRIQERGVRIFLDLKLHDIPNTVAAAVRSASGLGVELLTLHASGGRRMLEAAAGARDGSLALLAVTVLTSLDSDGLGEAWGRPEGANPSDEAPRLAGLAMECGIDGVVASAWEAGSIRRQIGSAASIVTPGIRLEGGAAHDQRRVATPSRAVQEGATHLVLGRAVTAAEDPQVALAAVRSEIAGAVGGVR